MCPLYTHVTPQSQLVCDGVLAFSTGAPRDSFLGIGRASSYFLLGLKTWCGVSHCNLIANKSVGAWSMSVRASHTSGEHRAQFWTTQTIHISVRRRPDADLTAPGRKSAIYRRT